MSKKTIENSKGQQGGLLGRQGSTGAGEGFDWGSVDAGLLAELVELVTGRGGAIRFGYSRDGQAGSIGLYYGDQRDTLYLRPSEDFSDATGIIVRTFENFPYSNGKSPDYKG